MNEHKFSKINESLFKKIALNMPFDVIPQRNLVPIRCLPFSYSNLSRNLINVFEKIHSTFPPAMNQNICRKTKKTVIRLNQESIVYQGDLKLFLLHQHFLGKIICNLFIALPCLLTWCGHLLLQFSIRPCWNLFRMIFLSFVVGAFMDTRITSTIFTRYTLCNRHFTVTQEDNGTVDGLVYML